MDTNYAGNTPNCDADGQIEPSPPPRSKHARALIPTWTDLSENRRRDLGSALRTVEKICADADRRAAATSSQRDHAGDPGSMGVLLDCKHLNQRLFAPSPVTCRLKDQRFANVLSEMRTILRRLGRHAPDERKLDGLSAEWQVLVDGLNDACERVCETSPFATRASRRVNGEFRRMPLVGFIRFCSCREIAPLDVSPATLADYQEWCGANLLGRSVASKGRLAMAAWNWAREHIPGWPAVNLTGPGTRDRYTRPLKEYPESFQEDVAQFVRRLSFSDPDDIFADNPFDDDGKPVSPRPRAARPKTVATRCFHIRQAAGALERAGVPRETITSLRILVDPPESAKIILNFFWRRQNKGIADTSKWKGGSQVGGVAECLRQIARYHCGLPEKDVARITHWTSRVQRDRKAGMTPKNRARLRALVEPRTRAMLLHLPARQMKQATEQEFTDRTTALVALHAVALEILLICPMRLSNLTSLRLDQHLQRIGGNGRLITHIIVPEEETKNDNALEWPIPAESAHMIETYLRRFRPLIAETGNAYLFPGQGLASRSTSAMTSAIHDPIARELGCEVNPHLLRHFAAWIHLRNHPGEYETVRRVLNHKSIETTVKFYVAFEAAAAAERFDAVVLKERRLTRDVANAAFAGRGGRRKAVSVARSRKGGQ